MKQVFNRNFPTSKSYPGKARNHPASRAGKADLPLAASVFLLLFFGIIMVYDSSVALAIRDFSDPYHFVKEQLKWMVFGVLALFVVSRIDYRRLRSVAVPLLIATIVLLVGVFIPGIGIRVLGASRWVDFGLFVVQPAELAKLSLIVYLSAWFTRKETGGFQRALALTGAVVLLVILEPDLGTAVVITLIGLSMYYYSGVPARHFLIIIPALLLLVFILIFIAPYRMARLTTFFRPESDPLGASYQIRQVLLSLGSGGWFGVGMGQSKQKYEYLPEANTDSIFAIIGEETGFFGSLGFILLYMFVVYRGFEIAKKASEQYGRMLALGITSWIGIQTGINLAAMVALLPLTGVPLPLISYGGSGLIIILTALGILLSISRYNTS